MLRVSRIKRGVGVCAVKMWRGIWGGRLLRVIRAWCGALWNFASGRGVWDLNKSM